MEFNPKAFFQKRLEDAAKCYVSDLNAMSEQLLQKSPGGTARTPYDFTYEVAYVNQRISKRLAGSEVEPWDPREWLKAPSKFQTRASAIESIESSVKQILNAWSAIPPSEVNKSITVPSGETTPIELISLAATHLMYHDAQMNYLQTLESDGEVHWQF